MQNRRSFLKAGIAGSVFLPTFADLSSKTEEKSAVAKPREINIGIVGFGGWGNVIASNLMRCKGVRVRCVCDIWKFQMQRARAFFKSWKNQEVNGYLDFREMLDAEAKNIEAVIVATPDWVHCEQVCECLRRGLHVYCAPPMADTLEKSAEMCRAARTTGKLLQIGHLRRSSPAYKLAFEHVVPEILDRLLFAQAESRITMWPMNTIRRPPKSDVLAKYGYDNAEQFMNWRWFRKYGPGEVLRRLASQADLFCWAWGVPPHSVTAVGGRDIYRPPRENLDNLSSVFEFKLPDGSAAHATHHFATAYKRSRFEFEEFNGLRAILHLSMYSMYGDQKLDGPANYVRRTWNMPDMQFAKKWRAFVDKGWILPSEADRKYNEIDERDCSPTTIEDVSSICPLNVKQDREKSLEAFHLENFLAAIRGEEKLNAPADKVYASMVAAFGALRSAARRETVCFKPTDFTP